MSCCRLLRGMQVLFVIVPECHGWEGAGVARAGMGLGGGSYGTGCIA